MQVSNSTEGFIHVTLLFILVLDRPSFSHTSSYVSCDSSGSGIFQQTIQLHIADTGGAPILRYIGVYTNNLLGVSTPINTTNSSYTITGLNCSLDYTVAFNAVNCAGSTATAPTTYKGVTNSEQTIIHIPHAHHLQKSSIDQLCRHNIVTNKHTRFSMHA